MDDYRLTLIQDLEKRIHETQEMVANDPEMAELAKTEIAQLQEEKKQLEQSIAQTKKEAPSDSFDDRNIILEIKGAAGGEEAKIWGDELLRMYMRYAEIKGCKVEQLDEKIIKISGTQKSGGAFGLFKYEAGVHRVQRIPKTEKKGRVHTSTATVSVLPELEDLDLYINPEDVDFEAFRSGGHGGQNVNKVSTAVRLVHRPSGIIVTCQTQRFQAQNRNLAMEMLRAKLWEREIEKQQSEIASIRSTQVGRGMRSEKIRTYNFPQDRVTDHRVNESWHNLPLILDGNIDDMVSAMKRLEENTEKPEAAISHKP